MANAKRLLDEVKEGRAHYDIIEVMACPGGCVCGGGQPIHSGFTQNFTDIGQIRGQAIYQGELDTRPVRKSHENPLVQELYRDVIGEPGGANAHKWLHTKHVAQPKYPGLESEK